MMNPATPEKEVKTIRLLGIVLVVTGVSSAAILLFWSGSPFALAKLQEVGSFLPLYLILPSVVLYIATGIGLFWRTRWAYVLLKCLLYLLGLAFPIGTVIAYLALSYLGRPNIKRHFGFKVTDISTPALHEKRWFKITGVMLACALFLVFVWMMLAF